MSDLISIAMQNNPTAVARAIDILKTSWWTHLHGECNDISGPISCNNCNNDGFANDIIMRTEEDARLYPLCYPKFCTCPDGSEINRDIIELFVMHCLDPIGFEDHGIEKLS